MRTLRWPPSNLQSGWPVSCPNRSQGDIEAGNGVDVVAAEEAAHAHQVVQILLDNAGVAGIAAANDRREIFAMMTTTASGATMPYVSPSSATTPSRLVTLISTDVSAVG